MKGKRVDVYLAKANFWQILFVALAGGCVAEFTNGNVLATILAGISGLIAYGYMILYYKKAEKLTNKKKKRNHAID